MRFLAHLAQSANVSASAVATAIGRNTAYTWKASELAFAAAWDDALAQGLDTPVAEAGRRAWDGTLESLTCRDGLVHGHDSQPVMVLRFSDGLLGLLLKGSRLPPFPARARGRMDNFMARRGKGAGWGGPAKGAGCGFSTGQGWGGPAKGIGHNSGEASPFESGNDAASGAHSFHRSESGEALLEVLWYLAFHAPNEGSRISAAVAWLNRVEGPCKPMKAPGLSSTDFAVHQ